MTLRNKLMRTSAILSLALTPLLSACDTGPSDPYAAAKEALAKGEPRTALEYAATALDQDPDNPDIMMLVADAAMALGEPDRAITELEKIPQSADNYSIARAKLIEAQVDGNYMAAAGETLASLELDNPQAYISAVIYYSAKGENEDASLALDQALEAYPDNPVLIAFDAERIWTRGRIDASLARLEPVLALTPPVYEAHLFAGRARLSMRDLDAAEKHFEKVLSVRPVEPTALLAMAAIANDRGDKQMAGNWLDKMGKSRDPSPAWVLFAAQMAFEADDLDRAFALVEKAPPALANEPRLLRLRGLIDAKRDQHAMAALSLGNFVKATGGDVVTRQLLARSLGEQGKFGEAWEAIAPVVDHPQMDLPGLGIALQVAAKASPGDVGRVKALIEARQSAPSLVAEMREASVAIRAGDWAKADEIYAPLVDGKGKTDPALLNNASAVKSKLGEHSDAVALARRALAQAPTSPEIMDTLGWALWQQGGNAAEARTILTKAREAAPNNREIAEHWSIAHAE